MKITYPNKIAWRRPIAEGEEDFFTGKKQTRLRKLLDNLNLYGISHRFVEPDEVFFERFLPEYEKMIGTKDNALSIDVRNYQIRDGDNFAKRMALEIYDKDKVIGATIFFDCRLSANVAFKAYSNKWLTPGPQIGPSLYSEFLMYQWAKEHNKKFISLGLDRNPYGPNSSIGLATYKLSAGYNPVQPKNCELLEMDTETISTDTLVFRQNDNNSNQIKKATLLASKQDDYELLLSQSKDILEIDIIKL